MPLSVGDKLGHYEILAHIGAGGMGEVYRAKDTKLEREVAIKVLPEAFANDLEPMTRFQREAEVLASLNHLWVAKTGSAGGGEVKANDRRPVRQTITSILSLCIIPRST